MDQPDPEFLVRRFIFRVGFARFFGDSLIVIVVGEGGAAIAGSALCVAGGGEALGGAADVGPGALTGFGAVEGGGGAAHAGEGVGAGGGGLGGGGLGGGHGGRWPLYEVLGRCVQCGVSFLDTVPRDGMNTMKQERKTRQPTCTE